MDVMKIQYFNIITLCFKIELFSQHLFFVAKSTHLFDSDTIFDSY